MRNTGFGGIERGRLIFTLWGATATVAELTPARVPEETPTTRRLEHDNDRKIDRTDGAPRAIPPYRRL
ncbi:MAG: hypothetical protein WAL04_09880 [Acidimicrobiales bacterium]